MDKLTWVWASDGRGEHPFGFYCERCGVEEKVATPTPVDDYLKASRRFTDEHKRCLAREGQSNGSN